MGGKAGHSRYYRRHPALRTFHIPARPPLMLMLADTHTCKHNNTLYRGLSYSLDSCFYTYYTWRCIYSAFFVAIILKHKLLVFGECFLFFTNHRCRAKALLQSSPTHVYNTSRVSAPASRAYRARRLGAMRVSVPSSAQLASCRARNCRGASCPKHAWDNSNAK